MGFGEDPRVHFNAPTKEGQVGKGKDASAAVRFIMVLQRAVFFYSGVGISRASAVWYTKTQIASQHIWAEPERWPRPRAASLSARPRTFIAFDQVSQVDGIVF